MWSAIWAGVKAFGSVLNVVQWYQRWRKSQADKKAGQNEQKISNLEGRDKSLAQGRRTAHRVATDSKFRDRVRKWATRAGDK